MDVKDLVDVVGEAGVIASLIYNPELCYHSEDLTERHFNDTVNSVMYYAITSLVKKGIFKVDAVNILSVISDSPKLQKMYNNVTSETINEIISLGEGIARIEVEDYVNLAETVRNKAFRRNMYLKLKQCERLCFEEDEIEVQQKIVDEIDSVINDFSTMENIKIMSDLVDGLWEEVENVQTNGNFLDFKFPELNEFVRMSKQETVIFYARAKAGKSIMMTNCLKTLLDNDEIVLYVDTEISDRQFFMRMVAHLSQVRYRDIETGNLTESDKEKIAEARKYMKSKKFIHVYMPVIEDSTLKTLAYRMKNKYGITAMIVDYIKSNTKHALEAYANSAYLGKITDTIKGVSGKLDIYTLACVQGNKDGSVAMSANIERNCSALIHLDRKTEKEIASDGGREFGNMKLKIIANRSGRLHDESEYISIFLDGDRCTFAPCKQPEKVEPF